MGASTKSNIEKIARKNWLSDYLRDNNFRALNFVGKYRGRNDVTQIVTDIRKVLNLTDKWAGNYLTWEEALNSLIYRIESIGLIMVFTGVVEKAKSETIPD